MWKGGYEIIDSLGQMLADIFWQVGKCKITHFNNLIIRSEFATYYLAYKCQC